MQSSMRCVAHRKVVHVDKTSFGRSIKARISNGIKLCFTQSMHILVQPWLALLVDPRW
jgi:hypothetical protein